MPPRIVVVCLPGTGTTDEPHQEGRRRFARYCHDHPLFYVGVLVLPETVRALNTPTFGAIVTYPFYMASMWWLVVRTNLFGAKREGRLRHRA